MVVAEVSQILKSSYSQVHLRCVSRTFFMHIYSETHFLHTSRFHVSNINWLWSGRQIHPRCLGLNRKQLHSHPIEFTRPLLLHFVFSERQNLRPARLWQFLFDDRLANVCSKSLHTHRVVSMLRKQLHRHLFHQTNWNMSSCFLNLEVED